MRAFVDGLNPLESDILRFFLGTTLLFENRKRFPPQNKLHPLRHHIKATVRRGLKNEKIRYGNVSILIKGTHSNSPLRNSPLEY